MTIGKNIRARKEGVGGDGIGMRGIPHSARGAREGEREGERETVKETQVAIIFGYCGQGTIEGAKFVCSKKENDSTPQKTAKCTPNECSVDGLTGTQCQEIRVCTPSAGSNKKMRE